MINSREKGKRGEREACEALQHVTGIPWMRTAQASGKHTADVMPVDFTLHLHVEVKRCKRGMAWVELRLNREPFLMMGDLFVSRLATLPRLIDCTMLATKGKRARKVEGWMRQAVRDCKYIAVPIVLFRQDDCEWCIAWDMKDDDRVMQEFRKCAAFVTPEG